MITGYLAKIDKLGQLNSSDQESTINDKLAELNPKIDKEKMKTIGDFVQYVATNAEKHEINGNGYDILCNVCKREYDNKDFIWFADYTATKQTYQNYKMEINLPENYKKIRPRGRESLFKLYDECWIFKMIFLCLEECIDKILSKYIDVKVKRCIN